MASQADLLSMTVGITAPLIGMDRVLCLPQTSVDAGAVKV